MIFRVGWLIVVAELGDAAQGIAGCRVDLRADGRVYAVWGYGQLVRCDYRGTWERAGSRLRFEYKLEDGWIDGHLLDYSIDHGHFDLVDHDTGERHTYGCRITFEASPFPEHCDTQSVYYGCAER